MKSVMPMAAVARMVYSTLRIVSYVDEEQEEEEE
jgi:hypothetical protein